VSLINTRAVLAINPLLMAGFSAGHRTDTRRPQFGVYGEKPAREGRLKSGRMTNGEFAALSNSAYCRRSHRILIQAARPPQGGEVFQEHPMNEDVTAPHFAQEKSLNSMIEETNIADRR